MSTKKSYFENMAEISKEELLEGLVGFGLFADKIPPFLTSKPFYDFCLSKKKDWFNKQKTGFIQYENMRHINIPRSLSIPNPIAYWNLCSVLSEHWDKIQKHFQEKTKDHKYKISRIHIRKIKDTESLFSMDYDNSEYGEETVSPSNENCLFNMNYKNFRIDDYPEPDLLIGKNYLVKADISNCFFSIYTHSIPWALVGKERSKEFKDDHSKWFNEIDRFTRNLKNEETHGILIGSHAFNLISEIILVVVDHNLYLQNYRFVRNIDDYTFYAETHEKSKNFLSDLSVELKKFNLHLNHKKTEILKLPQASTNHWVRKLNSHVFTHEDRELRLNEVQAFLDVALDLMQKNHDNSAIVNYTVKVLAKKKLTNNARDYYIKTMHHLVLIYPYLVSLLDETVFKPFNAKIDEIEEISKNIFNLGKIKNLFESMSFAIYFSIKYNFLLSDDLFSDVCNSNDCILLLSAYLHDNKNKKKKELKKYKDLAKEK